MINIKYDQPLDSIKAVKQNFRDYGICGGGKLHRVIKFFKALMPKRLEPIFLSRSDVVTALRSGYASRGDFFHSLTPNDSHWHDARRRPVTMAFMLYRYPEFTQLFAPDVFDRKFLEDAKALYYDDTSWREGQFTQASTLTFETMAAIYLSHGLHPFDNDQPGHTRSSHPFPDGAQQDDAAM